MIDATLRQERTAAVRSFLVWTVALLGVPVWVTAAWRGLLPEAWRGFVLMAHMGAFIGMLVAAFADWRVRVRLVAIIAEAETDDRYERALAATSATDVTDTGRPSGSRAARAQA